MVKAHGTKLRQSFGFPHELWDPNRMKKKAYKFRFYPTDDQALLLAKTFGCVRFVYNRILKIRTDAYYQDGTSINYSAASEILTDLKKIQSLSG